MRFQRAAQIDADFYLLPLTNIERAVYFYLSSRCATKWGVPEATMVSVLRIDIKRIRAALNILDEINLVKRWKLPRPKCTEYQVTLTTEKSWGIGSKRTLLNRSKRTLLRGANAPYDGEQTPLSPITIVYSTDSSYDTALLSIVLKSARTWHFAKRPMGDTGIIPARHQRTLLEIIKTIIGQGNSAQTKLMENLDAIRDYLAETKDVMSDDGRDYRGKTLGQWLSHWPDQLHRAQSYLDLKRKNIVKMPQEGTE